jgi:hypothetical protein
MKQRSVWLRLFCIGLLCCILGGVFWTFPVLSNLFVSLSAISIACSLGLWAKERFRRRDPYDLEELREMILNKTYEEIEVPEVDSEGDLYCIHCDLVYGVRLRACPKCGCHS